MRRMPVARCLAIFAIVAAPASVAVALPAGGAYASGSPSITCSALSGTETSVSLSKCTDPKITDPGGKAGAGVGVSKVTSKGSVYTWGPGGKGGTATASYKVKVAAGGVCGSADELITETTMVKSGTGAAKALVGQSGSSEICVVKKTGKVSLAPGHKLTI